MKSSRSAELGPVSLRRGLTAPERRWECDATAEARGSGGSGELVVAEKSEEKRRELVVEEPALEASQLAGAERAGLRSLDLKDGPGLDQ
jgi:hypothetical protein